MYFVFKEIFDNQFEVIFSDIDIFIESIFVIKFFVTKGVSVVFFYNKIIPKYKIIH